MEGGVFTVSFASAALAVFVFYILLYVVALIRRDNTVADIGWGIGFIIAAFVVLWQRDMLMIRQVVITALVCVWGVRLSLHIWLRSRGKGEDWRYKQWRKQWKEHWVIRSFLQIYVLQSFFLMIAVLPVLYVNTFGGSSWGVLDMVGLLLWAGGFVWEAVGDHQLTRFKERASNRGHVLRTGLWRYSRHPNYFGEALMWWGIWVMALSVPGGWQTAIGPLFITFLLLRVSGVALIEKHFSANPEYLAYQKRTNAFFPWFSSK